MFCSVPQNAHMQEFRFHVRCLIFILAVQIRTHPTDSTSFRQTNPNSIEANCQLSSLSGGNLLGQDVLENRDWDLYERQYGEAALCEIYDGNGGSGQPDGTKSTVLGFLTDLICEGSI